MRPARFRRPVLALALCSALAGTMAAPAAPAAVQLLTPADKAEIAAATLDAPTLAKLGAAAREGRALVAGREAGDSDDGAPPPHGLTEWAARLDAKPEAHAVLARHGLTARTAIVDMLALSQAYTAMQLMAQPGGDRALAGQPVNRANVAFVTTHRAEVDQLMATMDSQPMNDDQARQLAAVGGMDPTLRADCVRSSVVLFPVVSLGLPGHAVTRDAVLKAADRITTSSAKLTATRPRQDADTVVAELRAHADDPDVLRSPRMEAATKDLKAWTEANCQALRGGAAH